MKQKFLITYGPSDVRKIEIVNIGERETDKNVKNIPLYRTGFDNHYVKTEMDVPQDMLEKTGIQCTYFDAEDQIIPWKESKVNIILIVEKVPNKEDSFNYSFSFPKSVEECGESVILKF